MLDLEIEELNMNLEEFGFESILNDIEEKERNDAKLPADTYELIIECEDEIDLQNKYEALTEEGYVCRVSIL